MVLVLVVLGPAAKEADVVASDSGGGKEEEEEALDALAPLKAIGGSGGRIALPVFEGVASGAAAAKPDGGGGGRSAALEEENLLPTELQYFDKVSGMSPYALPSEFEVSAPVRLGSREAEEVVGAVALHCARNEV